MILSLIMKIHIYFHLNTKILYSNGEIMTIGQIVTKRYLFIINFDSNGYKILKIFFWDFKFSKGVEKVKVNNSKSDSFGSRPKGKLKQTSKDFFNVTPIGYFIISYEGIIHDVNPAATKLIGLTKDALRNKGFENYIFTEDQNTFRNCRLKLKETGVPQACEIRIFHPDGQQLWLRLDLGISENDDESEILLTMTDITFRRQIDDIQSFLLGYSWSKSGKDFFEALAEYLAKTLNMDYVCIDRLVEREQEAQTVAIYFDGQFEDNVRYTLEDTPCGKVLAQMVCCYPSKVRYLFPQDVVLQNMIAESYAGIILWGSNGKPIGLIAVIGRKPMTDPRLTEMLLKQFSIRAASELEHRQMEAAIINSRNELAILVKEKTAALRKTNEVLKKEIHDRKQKEKSLLIAEEKYRTVADFTYDWETWIGTDGKFVYVSPSCYKVTGYSVDEFMDDPSLVIKMTHPEDREIVQKHYSESKNGNVLSCRLDFRILKRNGEECWIGHTCQPVFDARGRYIGQRGSNRDITERKRAESVLLASQMQLRALTQRIDAISENERIRIAREIHDELGHLLTALKYDIERLTDKPDLSKDFLKKELESITSILDSLIDSVRKIATELRPGILDHLGLCPAIEWQMKQFQKRTSISCEYNLSVMNITFDKNETTIIYRILQEILTNISRHSKANKVSVSLSKKDGQSLLIATDNGVGFEVMDRYDEYSLGLMGMHERALSIGAQLKIESTKGRGTTVTLMLNKN